MKLFSSVKDVNDIQALVQEALLSKQDPFAHQHLGKNKLLGLVFLNPSLRTRLSTQKAAFNLGMEVMVMNMDNEGWALETRDGVVMDGNTVEHMREAAAVMGVYCDILGLRSFSKLQNREEDYSEELFNKFIKYCGVPVVSLESATLHPLQSLADLVTIQENWSGVSTPSPLERAGVMLLRPPKVVLTWAPHVKALPQAVSNSFSEWMCRAKTEGLVDFVITHPEGYELDAQFTNGAKISYDQDEALQDADYIYVKNWSGYKNYGQVLQGQNYWMPDIQKLKLANPDAKVMHCLPVRRDLELASEILDGPQSLVIQQAGNRVWAAQAVLKRMLTAN